MAYFFNLSGSLIPKIENNNNKNKNNNSEAKASVPGASNKLGE